MQTNLFASQTVTSWKNSANSGKKPLLMLVYPTSLRNTLVVNVLTLLYFSCYTSKGSKLLRNLVANSSTGRLSAVLAFHLKKWTYSLIVFSIQSQMKRIIQWRVRVTISWRVSYVTSMEVTFLKELAARQFIAKNQFLTTLHQGHMQGITTFALMTKEINGPCAMIRMSKHLIYLAIWWKKNPCYYTKSTCYCIAEIYVWWLGGIAVVVWKVGGYLWFWLLDLI